MWKNTIALPRTLEEAQVTPYGLRGDVPYSKDKCAFKVLNKSVFLGWYGCWYQCRHKPGFGPDGLYCKQHAKMVK